MDEYKKSSKDFIYREKNIDSIRQINQNSDRHLNIN